MKKFRLVTSAAAMAAAVSVIAPGAMAAIVCNTPPLSGVLPLAVPQTTAGIYVNLVTGLSNVAPAAVPGWDINPFSSTQLTFFWNGGTGVNSRGMLIGGVHAVSPAGVPVGPGSTFGSTGSSSAAQMAPWRAGPVTGYLGISFMNEATATINFGWVSLTATGATTGLPGIINKVCYQNNGTQILTGQGAKGDFNNDGTSDLIFRNVADATMNKVWFMNGVGRLSETAITPNAPSADWRIRGADDWPVASPATPGGDGRSDLVFWNQSTGAVEFWLMNGVDRPSAPIALTGAAPLPANWDLSATGDFNGDGRPDIVWRDFTTQQLAIWKMGEGAVPGTEKTGDIVPSPDHAVDGNWIVVAAADYNNDGNTDLLWYNFSSGKIVTWYMNASVVRTTGQFTTPANAGDANWKVVASADYSRKDAPATPPEGSPDVVWRNETSGNQVVWHLDFNSVRVAGGFTSPGANTTPLDWAIAGPR